MKILPFDRIYKPLCSGYRGWLGHNPNVTIVDKVADAEIIWYSSWGDDPAIVEDIKLASSLGYCVVNSTGDNCIVPDRQDGNLYLVTNPNPNSPCRQIPVPYDYIPTLNWHLLGGKILPPGDRKYLASFLGNMKTYPKRKRLFELRCDEILIEEKNWWDQPEEIQQEMLLTMSDIVCRSAFTLCPRGNGPSSIRVTEAIFRGSIPVFIDDTTQLFNTTLDFAPRFDLSGDLCALKAQLEHIYATDYADRLARMADWKEKYLLMDQNAGCKGTIGYTQLLLQEKPMVDVIKHYQERHDSHIRSIHDEMEVLQKRHDSHIRNIHDEMEVLQKRHDSHIRSIHDEMEVLQKRHDSNIRSIHGEMEVLQNHHASHIRSIHKEMELLQNQKHEQEKVLTDKFKKSRAEVYNLQARILSRQSLFDPSYYNLALYLESFLTEEVADLFNSQGEEFIEKAYRAVLHRQADRSGGNHYKNMISNGIAKMQILRILRQSEEGKLRGESIPGLDAAIYIYIRCCRLLPSKRSQNEAGELISTIVTKQMVELFGFQQDRFIEEAYRTVLGRGTDSEGRSHYLKLLQQGTPKINILKQLRQSEEGKWREPIPGLDSAIELCEHFQKPFIRGLFNKSPKKRKRDKSYSQKTPQETGQPVTLNPLRMPDFDLGPIKFLAHDGGFFSNFNYLVGEMYLGRQLYPLFAVEEVSRNFDKVQHFAYLHRDCPNSWLEFFKPVEYFPEDKTNLDTEYLKGLPQSFGHFCSPEFRFPANTFQLYNREDFPDWRWSVHKAVVNKISVADDIQSKIDGMLARMPGHRIAVHIRHPSHFVEAGFIYYQDYYNIIDRILLEHPESSIFMATDNELALTAFTQRYGDAVFYYPNVIRETIDDVLKWAFSLTHGQSDEMGFVGGKGFQTHYKLAASASNGDSEGIRAGKEVVTDVFTLAACHEFVCIASNITLACSYLNPEMKLHLISKGNPELPLVTS